MAPNASKTSMALIVETIEKKARQSVKRGATDSSANAIIQTHIELLIDQTDTPLLNDTVFDPLIKQLLPKMIDEAFEAASQRRCTRCLF